MADSAVQHRSMAPTLAADRGAVFDAFRLPIYRTVWAGTMLAFLAYQMWSPVQGVVAFDLTGDNRAVGFVIFGQGLAMFLLNPFSGAIADRVSKKILIVLCQAIAFATMVASGVLVTLDLMSVPILAAGAFTVGIMFAFNGPARNALLGDLVPGDRLGSAVAMVQVGANFSRTAAPFLAGALLAWQAVGAAGAYFFMATVMGIVILTYLKIPETPMRSNRHETSILEDVRIGWRFVCESPRLLQSIMSFQAVAILGFSYIVLIPGYSKSVMDAGNAGVGILLGAAAAGGIVTSLVAAGAAGSRHANSLLHGAALLLGLALIGTGLAPSFPLAVLAMVFVGGGSSAFQTLNNVIALRHATPEFYGRVMGFMFVAWGSTNLVGLPVGYLADVIGERTVIAGLGGLLCLSTAFFALWSRKLEAYPPAATARVVKVLDP